MRWVISALVAVVGAAFLLPGVAQAHEIGIAGTTRCLEEDGTWSINWTVLNTEPVLSMTITQVYINHVGVPNPFDLDVVPGSESTTATTHHTSGEVSVTLGVDATFNPGAIPSDNESVVAQPTELCPPPPCEYNENLPADSEDCVPPEDPCPFNPSLSAGDPNCVPPEDPCPFNPNLSAGDPNCAPPPEIAQVCVDTDGDGQGDEYQVFTVGNLPAGAITSADGEACNPVTLPQIQEVQAVTTISEVLPVALPASGQGFGADGGIAQSTWIAALVAALVATGSLSLLTARRRTADAVAVAAPLAPAAATTRRDGGSAWLLAVAAGAIGLAALKARGRKRR